MLLPSLVTIRTQVAPPVAAPTGPAISNIDGNGRNQIAQPRIASAVHCQEPHRGILIPRYRMLRCPRDRPRVEPTGTGLVDPETCADATSRADATSMPTGPTARRPA